MSPLLTPDSGLLFWMLLSFGIVVFILVKFGFPVIIKMVEDRKAFIDDSLLMAEKAQDEFKKLKLESDSILENARKEHFKIINEATIASQEVIKLAHEKAKIEAEKIISDARLKIIEEKEEALHDIRKSVAELSVGIAEKLLKNQLDIKNGQDEMINRLLDEQNISKS